MLDEQELRLRLENVIILVSSVTTVEERSITPLLETLVAIMSPEEAARFEELAEEAYGRWEERAKDLLAEELAAAYREATTGA
ncbi:MAG: hypothetical protein M3301_06785 [Chloroflexota bacterium]|nr:hypothetical protein [Chloroflexota bacterium]